MVSGPLDYRGPSAPRAAHHQREAFLPGCERAHRRLRQPTSPQYTVASVRLSLVEWATRNLADELGPPARNLRLFLETTGFLAAAVASHLLLPVPLWAVLSGTALLSVWRLRSRPLHCSARRLARRVESRLRAGSTLEEVAPQLSSLLAVHPHDDNARFLLALDRLNEEEPLEALMQLAPLRARHPDVTEVDLASVLAELSLGRWSRAQDLLAGIDLVTEPAWASCVQQLERACRGKARRASGDSEAEPTGGVVPDSTGSQGPRHS